ncbi:SusC/RagA family TonB-linked outer membrane protein [Foetidibacter luteolus]|uniref:SusC/RagA family TonB-linked outer membrane protein n=1 Tax=Foetidibacter luteolus TaxID=2608880 RepID=UPI00129BC080|nr:TonB-dependent receptor [Foetidibacter luteolus]
MKRFLAAFGAKACCLILLLVIFCFTHVLAQNGFTVSGKVTDDKGQGLSNVTVQVKGSSIGAITDANGAFSIRVPSENATLVFSSTGYQSKEMRAVKDREVLVLLLTSEARLDSVVVVAYGTQKKSSLTSSISTINGSDIASQPVANITNSLAGRAAGIVAMQGTGEPGFDGSNIIIRGISTTGNTQPLVIVDGVPRNYSQVDPNSIASISVLKDAAAVAPYGMAGANGVILITTKRGKAGASSLSYNGYVGWQNPTKLTEFVDAYQYATMRNVANANVGALPVYSEYSLQKFRDGSDPDGHPNHNVLEELISRNRIITSHNLSLSGGSEKVRYYAGFSYLKQDGMWARSAYNQYNLIGNLDVQATKTTKVSLSMNGRVEDRNQAAVNTGFIFYQAFRTPAVAPLTFSNGLWGSYIGRTAYGNLHHSGWARTTGYTMLNQLSVEQQLPVKGLSVKIAASYDFNPFSPTNANNPGSGIVSQGKIWSTPIPFYAVDTTKRPYEYTLAGNDGPAKPVYTQYYNQSQAFTYQGFINYNNKFGLHDLGLLIVLEARNTKSSVFGASRSNFSVNVPELNNGSSNATDISNYGYSSEAKQRSALYRLSYGFGNKYLLEASGRYDGNYYFAPGKRFGFFPAFSAGWRLSEENFIKSITWISNLKLRASYGESGALAGAPFQYLSSYTLYGNAAIINGIAGQGLYENAEPNRSITWERAKKTDIGIEAVLWNGLLTIEADYFREKRDNMLFAPDVVVPAEYGISLSQVNSGKMSNRGFELTLGSSYAFSKDFRIGLTGNITYARNKLERVFETSSTYDNPNRRRTGRPLNTQFGYRALGYFQVSDDKNGNGIIDASEYPVSQPFGDLHPGDIKYEDVNGDGLISPDDEVEIGKSAVPQVVYGFSPTIRYKGFDITLLFQGAAGRNFYLSATAAWPFVNGASATTENLDYWTSENTNAKNPRLTPTPTANNTAYSSWWIRDASYLRLKTGELGYNLPYQVARKAGMQSARVFVSGQNLLTWSPVKNFDPEVSVSNGEYYPQQKVVTIGLNLNF